MDGEECNYYGYCWLVSEGFTVLFGSFGICYMPEVIPLNWGIFFFRLLWQVSKCGVWRTWLLTTAPGKLNGSCALPLGKDCCWHRWDGWQPRGSPLSKILLYLPLQFVFTLALQNPPGLETVDSFPWRRVPCKTWDRPSEIPMVNILRPRVAFWSLLLLHNYTWKILGQKAVLSLDC